jgi:hypothetical protein
MPAIRLSSVDLPHQPEEVARAHVKRDVGQHRHDLPAAPVGLHEVADADQRLR